MSAQKTTTSNSKAKAKTTTKKGTSKAKTPVKPKATLKAKQRPKK
jgi:hypothetical protein